MNACIRVVEFILRHPVLAPRRGMRARHHGAHPQRPRLGHVQRGSAHPLSHQLRVYKEGRHLHGPQIPERRRAADVHVSHGLQVSEDGPPAMHERLYSAELHALTCMSRYINIRYINSSTSVGVLFFFPVLCRA